MELFDTHSHYNDEKFDKDREQIIKEIKQKKLIYIFVYINFIYK